ncbi:MAG TPA: cysteine rich repeat-containing protein [Acetobacteraceae bacterium]|nr:cysteine rich repeat-containing protein [Acetobacteraceae bacterium]
MQRFRTVALATMLALLAIPTLAQQPTQAQANAIKQACRADYQSHCASVPTGGSAALACLQQNASSLSPGCQSALSAVGGGAAGASQPPHAQASPAPASPPLPPREEARLLRQSCGGDYRALCSGVEPGGGRAIGCLEAHRSKLSHQCRSALVAAHQSQ